MFVGVCFQTELVSNNFMPWAVSQQCLDASRPWLCYWILHSMELLNIPVSDGMTSQWVFILI